jgi:vitamin B12/bleomycin/antimicrobial peptide transport system ATP-binding/permease protein
MTTDTPISEAPTNDDAGKFLRDVWSLTKPYFLSEEWKSAWALLLSVIALNLFNVFLSVALSYWRNEFYNSLQNFDFNAFQDLLFTWHPVKPEDAHFGMNFQLGFAPIALVFIAVAVYATYLSQALQIRARRWSTRYFINDWTSDLAYYNIAITHRPGQIGTDNPDQRIAEDVRDFWASTLTVSVDFITTFCTFGSFLGILWSISGDFTFPEGWTLVGGMTISHYLVWAALVYAILGTWATHIVGRKLAALRFRQQKVEADFRYSLVRFRENAEGIALYGGEADETQNLNERFDAVSANWWDIMSRVKKLNALTVTYAQLAVIFPYAMAAPSYFTKKILLGKLMQIASAFDQVQSSLSWFVNTYATLAQWRSIVARLATFQRAIAVARAANGKGITVQDGSSAAVDITGLSLELPNGVKLLVNTHVKFTAGTSVVVNGASGSGKSTLFRAIAGIWPFGQGNVQRSVETCLFLPQKPYIPLGSLRRVVCYPKPVDAYDQASVKQALVDAGLAHLVDALDTDDNWPVRLSGGEQQRVALARALLFKPVWLFLDEATASLDPLAEEQLYKTIKARLPQTTIVSIAHRPTVAAFHDERLVMQRGENNAPGRLVRAAIDGGNK